MTNWSEIEPTEQLRVAAEIAQIENLEGLWIIGVHEDGTTETVEEATGYRYWYKDGQEVGTTAPWQLRA